MKIITSITSQPKQQFTIKLDNNEVVSVYLYYYSTQQSWYFDIQYKDYENKGNKIVLSPNILRHLKKILPFGIGIVGESNADPFRIDDFVEARYLMILLNQEDVNEFEASIYGE